MSIQNSTLHFHFPLVTGSDRPVFSDYNATMELLDEQIYSATSSVTVFAEQIAALQETSGEHTTELGELNTFKTEQQGINTANANRFLAITQAFENQAVTNNNKFNSVSIADAYDATKTYSVGDVVTYNGDRYRCITAVTTGEPFDADKWRGEDVQAVLDALTSGLSNTEASTYYKAAYSGNIATTGVINLTNAIPDTAKEIMVVMGMYKDDIINYIDGQTFRPSLLGENNRHVYNVGTADYSILVSYAVTNTQINIREIVNTLLLDASLNVNVYYR